CIVERQHHLEDYFFWAGFHGQFPEIAKSIVQALQLIPVKDWLTYFDEWYITQLITGDALEVTWPEMMDDDLKDMIEQLRHHTLAEFDNELNRHRSILHESYAASIRPMLNKSGGFNEANAERFFKEMSIEERSKWFPVQLLPMTTFSENLSTTIEKQQTEINHYILLKSKEPSLDLHWTAIQEMDCDIYAYVPPVNQRYLNEKLEMPQ